MTDPSDLIEHDNPLCSVSRSEDGSILSLKWWKTDDHRMLHREVDPAVYAFTEDEQLVRKAWYIDDRRHRDGDKPASVSFSIHVRSGKRYLSELKWFRQGDLHREEGPAHIKFSREGGVGLKKWAVDGSVHRLGGPAVIKYNNGSQFDVNWAINGHIYDRFWDYFHDHPEGEEKEKLLLNWI